MKQAVIALSLAILSCSGIIQAATTTPKSKRFDLNAVEGLSAPLDVPIVSDVPEGFAHISTGANSSAQVVDDCSQYSIDCPEPHAPSLAIEGALQIGFTDNMRSASLAYGGSTFDDKGLMVDAPLELSVTLLDSEGNLIGSQTAVENPNQETGWSSVEIKSSVPFQKIVLTPSNDDAWFISEATIEPVKQGVPEVLTNNRHVSNAKPEIADSVAGSTSVSDTSFAKASPDRTSGTVNDFAVEDKGVLTGPGLESPSFQTPTINCTKLAPCYETPRTF